MSYTETFESYSVGQTLPFGQLTADSNTFLASVVSGGATGSKSFQVFSECIWSDGFTYANFTTAFAYKAQFTGNPVKIDNHAGANSYTFFQLRWNFDSTISVLVAGIVVHTTAEPYNFFEWNFFDIDITVTDIAGFINISVNHFNINGISIYSGAILTSVATSTMPTGAAEINRMILGGGGAGVNWFDDLTVDTTPISGTPLVRATQGYAEILELLDSAKVRITQGIVETLLLPNSAQIRVTQGFIELILTRSAVTGAGWQIKEC